MIAANPDEYLISVRDARVSYPLPRRQRKVVLNKITLNIRPREFVTVVGPSGCGKSTLLRLVLGSQRPTLGEVYVANERVERLGRDRGIVYQKYSLFPHCTVLENIVIGPILEQTNLAERVGHLPKYWTVRRQAEQEAMQILDRIGLESGDARKYPYELSGGMRQRVAIAQAIIMRPKVLLMDEPFGALDDSTRQDMQLFILDQWSRHKMTVLFVTHDLEEAVFLGTRVIGLSQYWSNEPGEIAEGALIVSDKLVPGGHPKPTDFKYSREFGEIVKALRQEVLDENRRRHFSQFDLDHRDAWRPSDAWLNEPSSPEENPADE